MLRLSRQFTSKFPIYSVHVKPAPPVAVPSHTHIRPDLGEFTILHSSQPSIQQEIRCKTRGGLSKLFLTSRTGKILDNKATTGIL